MQLIKLGLLGKIGGAAGAALQYTLRALFNRADTGVLVSGDLETQAPGSVQDGAIIIDDTSTGTVEVLSNELKVVGSGAWDTTGFHSATPVPRAIGNVIGIDFRTTTNTQRAVSIVNNLASNLLADMEFWAGPSTVTAGSFDFKVAGGTAIKIATYSAATTYNLRFVLGGYDINGVPYKTGDTKSNFTYGVSVYIKGGSFTNYTLLWKTSVGSAANLYKALNSFDATALYADNALAPISDKAAILQPVHLDTFTDTNGTNITAHTPDVGGVATVVTGTFDIQSNMLNLTSVGADGGICVWSGEKDLFTHLKIQQAVGADGLIFRYSDINNFWLAQANGATNRFELYEKQAGTYLRHSFNTITKAAGGIISVRAVGSDINIYYDDVLTLSVTSTFNQTATGIGYRTATVGNKVDNLACWPATSVTYDSLLGGF